MSAADTRHADPHLSRPRLALLILAGVYPLITILLYGLSAVTEGWPIWQRSLVVAPVMVATVVWGVVPFVHRHFAGFVHPRR